MQAAIKTRRTGPGLPGEDWWNAFHLQWPRRIYRVLETPEGQWGEAWAALPERRVRFLDSPPPDPWIPVRHEAPVEDSIYGPVSWLSGPSAGETVNVYKVAWPVGGIFVPEEKSVEPALYEPLKVAPEILLDAQGAALEDHQALLGFVNRWGCLGVGIPGAEDFGADGVLRTSECLRELRAWITTVHALQNKKPTSANWKDLAEVFQEKLGGVHFGARPTHRGLVPLFPLRSLLDALYLELWGLTTGAKRLRQCKRCEHFFIRGREDQMFCTGRCARLWHVKLWKQRARRR